MERDSKGSEFWTKTINTTAPHTIIEVAHHGYYVSGEGDINLSTRVDWTIVKMIQDGKEGEA